MSENTLKEKKRQIGLHQDKNVLERLKETLDVENGLVDGVGGRGGWSKLGEWH